jgi:NhaA family Na+:H+ antiporter
MTEQQSLPVSSLTSLATEAPMAADSTAAANTSPLRNAGNTSERQAVVPLDSSCTGSGSLGVKGSLSHALSEPDSPNIVGFKKKRQHGLVADVWELIGDSWEVTHQFSTGLEVDCRVSTQTLDAKCSRVHLPSTSLSVLKQLRSSLNQPKAVALDVRLNDGSEGDSCCNLFNGLLEQVQDGLTLMTQKEAKAMLDTRAESMRGGLSVTSRHWLSPKNQGTNPKKIAEGVPGCVADRTQDDSDAESATSEALLEPDEGMEVLDVSVCRLPNYDEDLAPKVAFSRLREPLKHNCHMVRYAAVVLCSVADCHAPNFACEVGRALATTFMDEDFAGEVRRAPNKEPERVLRAFDQYLSMLTIVPTVHIMRNQEDCTPSSDSVISDYLLSDSLVHSMEKLICRVRGMQRKDTRVKLHHPRKRDSERRTSDKCVKLFVEVNELNSQIKEWRLTHRLRQGLEQDVNIAMSRPRLPRVSVAALEHVRRLMTPVSVAPNVKAPSMQVAVDMLLQQLLGAGLPQAAVESVTASVMERAVHGAYIGGDVPEEKAKGDDTPTKSQRVSKMPVAGPTEEQRFHLPAHTGELMLAHSGDEAVHILVVESAAVPKGHEVVGAFIRFSSPLQLYFRASDIPVRFLFLLVGPDNERERLSALGDSLAALTVDEDLMADLGAAQDVAGFTQAVDSLLNDLVLFPHAAVHCDLLRGNNGGGSHRPAMDYPRAVLGDNERSPKAAKSRSNPNGLTEKKGTNGDSFAEPVKTVPSAASAASAEATKPAEKSKDGKTASPCRKRLKWLVHVMQKYSLPLVIGVTTAMIWVNVDEHSYHEVIHTSFWEGAVIFGYDLNLHFLINDIFMCFFFGLAIKEVTEALLPGGSLSPLRRAANPLIATVGGIVVPILVYLVSIYAYDQTGAFDCLLCANDSAGGGHRRLASAGHGSQAATTAVTSLCEMSAIYKGWGVPTATDISLAWMFALVIFGAGHPCINFLLLLAIVDDAIGMVIIAVFYPNPLKPVEPVWLLLVLLSIAVSAALRKFQLQHWQLYIFGSGPIAWVGLLKAHVHPALALAVVVPVMPANYARAMSRKSERHLPLRLSSNMFGSNTNLGVSRFSARSMLEGLRRRNNTVNNLGKLTADMEQSAKSISSTIVDVSEERKTSAVRRAAVLLAKIRSAPLHAFEHAMKLPVDLGMFFFGLANAGVKVEHVGPVTWSTVLALGLGKMLGIAGFGMLADCCGFALPEGVTFVDLLAAGCLGGVGLTVALFVANEAFPDPGLQGQAKMGAVLSTGLALVAWAIRWFGNFSWGNEPLQVDENDITQLEDDVSMVRQISKQRSDQSGEDGREDMSESEADDTEWIDDALVDDICQTLWTMHRYESKGTAFPLRANGSRSNSKIKVTGADSSGGGSSAGESGKQSSLFGLQRLSLPIGSRSSEDSDGQLLQRKLSKNSVAVALKIPEKEVRMGSHDIGMTRASSKERKSPIFGPTRAPGEETPGGTPASASEGLVFGPRRSLTKPEEADKHRMDDLEVGVAADLALEAARSGRERSNTDGGVVREPSPRSVT